MVPITIDFGRAVLCDVCSTDYTDSQETGGFIFGGYAYCPKCQGDAFIKIKNYGEDGKIEAICPIGVTFADFVREYRGSEGNKLVITQIPRHLRPR